MRNILLVSHGSMAEGVKASLEMIMGKQEQIHVVSLRPDGDNLQFEEELKMKMQLLNGPVLIIADLLGGTPCNVSLKHYAQEDRVEIIAGMSLPLVIEAAMGTDATSQELVKRAKNSVVDVKSKMLEVEESSSEAKATTDLDAYREFQGQAKIVNARIDERLIHGQVAGIWSTSLDTQRIIVINDEASADGLQKSSLRMAAPTSMRLSVLTQAEAARNITGGKYGTQRLFLVFKTPQDVLGFLEAGGHLAELNVGNMSYKEGTRQITKSIQVLPEEETLFTDIFAKGVKITAQLVPNDPSIDFMEKLNA